MFNLGGGEILLLIVVLLLVLGPKRLPTFMKTAGKTLRQFRQATRDLRQTTGIDDMLNGTYEEQPPHEVEVYALDRDGRMREQPPEGPDLAGTALVTEDAQSSPAPTSSEEQRS